MNFLVSRPEIGELDFKESRTAKHPFKRFKIDIREEIVTLKDKSAAPPPRNNHLAPSEWQAVLDSDEDAVIIDVRNFYETEIVMFKGAHDMDLKKFSEFPSRLKDLNLPRDKKVLMYCTGGIRCEKAIIEMQRQGYQNVFQLEGGILRYLEEFPEGSF